MPNEYITDDVTLRSGDVIAEKLDTPKPSGLKEALGLRKKDVVQSPDGSAEITIVKKGKGETRAYERDGIVFQRVDINYVDAKSDSVESVLYHEPNFSDTDQMILRRRVENYNVSGRDGLVPLEAIAGVTEYNQVDDERTEQTDFLGSKGEKVGRAYQTSVEKNGNPIRQFSEVLHYGPDRSQPTFVSREQYDVNGLPTETYVAKRNGTGFEERRVVTTREGMITTEAGMAFSVITESESNTHLKDAEPTTTNLNIRSLYDKDPSTGGKMVRIDSSSQHAVSDEVITSDSGSAEFKYSSFGNLTRVEEFLPDGNTVVVYAPEGVNLLNKKVAEDFSLQKGAKEGFTEVRRYELNPTPKETSPEEAPTETHQPPVEAPPPPPEENVDMEIASSRQALNNEYSDIHEL